MARSLASGCKTLLPCGRQLNQAKLYKAAAATVVFLTLAVLVTALTLFAQHFSHASGGIRESWCPVDAAYQGELLLINIFQVLVQAPIAVVLLSCAVTPHLRANACYATLVWLQSWIYTGSPLLACQGIYAGNACDFISLLFLYASWLVAPSMLYAQLRVLEQTCQVNLGTQALRNAIGIGAVLFAWGTISTTGPLYSSKNVGLLRWAVVHLILAFILLLVRAFHKLLALAQKLSASFEGRMQKKALAGASMVRSQMFGWVLLFIAILQYLLISGVRYGYLWPVAQEQIKELDTATIWSCSSMSMLQSIAALAISGSFSGGLLLRVKKFRSEELRHEKRSALRTQETMGTPEAEAWQKTVEELGHRGFTVAKLLDFYKDLRKEFMPHFDPRQHTTNDVVRQAIIPQSSSQQSALATIMMDGKPTRPQKMVTHNWGNLFRDLVAAILADALGEDEFSMVSKSLDSDVDHLRSLLERDGQLSATYWVCAFSINQHCGICGTVPDGAKDPVTGKCHPVCPCGRPKAFNTDSPLLGDKSIHCEMNKFDDMMSFLASTDRSFKQVVAVDFNLQLFGRAWCVAELAAAHEAGMTQNLLVSSADVIEESEAKLKELKVESMQASRPEDVQEILSKINDKDAFNQRLQELIFGKLLGGWQDLDPAEQMEALGHLLRWLNQTTKASVSESTPDISQQTIESNGPDDSDDLVLHSVTLDEPREIVPELWGQISHL